LGRDFNVALLERVARRSERLLEQIEEALAARILLDSSEAPDTTRSHTRWFADALPRALGPGRVRLHRKIGCALEGTYARASTNICAELSYHFLQAAPLGEIERASTTARERCARASASTPTRRRAALRTGRSRRTISPRAQTTLAAATVARAGRV